MSSDSTPFEADPDYGALRKPKGTDPGKSSALSPTALGTLRAKVARLYKPTDTDIFENRSPGPTQPTFVVEDVSDVPSPSTAELVEREYVSSRKNTPTLLDQVKNLGSKKSPQPPPPDPPTPPPENSAPSLTESDEDMVSYPTPGSIRGEIRYPTPEGLKEEKTPQSKEGSPPRKQPTPLPQFDVNEIVEITGWGPYQYKVVAVMGIMSFADAAEIWLATMILKDLVCEWNLNTLEKALIPAVVYFFYAVGSILSGKLADKFGRFPVLLTNSYVLVISAICSALAWNYYVFIVCRSITGFCIGGNYGTSIVYCSEMVPANRRSWNMFILEMFWTAGSVYECVAAFFVMDLENGWRIQIVLTAIPCLIMLILMHFMDESPRYLTITNNRKKAMKVITKMCEQNNVPVPNGELVCSDVRNGQYSEIWAKPYTRGSLLISINFYCNMFLIFAIIVLIPDMMSYNYCMMDTFFNSTYINGRGCLVYTKAEYLFLIVVALMFVPGFLIGAWGAESVGRKKTFIGSVYWSAVFTILLFLCITSVITYIELSAAIIGYSTYNTVLWIYAPEYYPTYMRSTAVGVQNGIGKLGAAVGTFLVTYLDSESIYYSLYCFTVIVVVACISVLFFDRETMGENLVDGRLNEQTALVQNSGEDESAS